MENKDKPENTNEYLSPDFKKSCKLIFSVINSMRDAVSVIDVSDYRIIEVNDVFLKEYGFSDKSEVIGKTCYETMHCRKDRCSAVNYICPIADAVKEGIHKTAEHVHFEKDGAERYIEITASPVWNEDGRILQVIHVSRDVTERRMAERELKEKQLEIFRKHEELQRIFKYVESVKKEWERTIDCVGDMIILTDKEWRIKRCNRTFKDFVNLTYEDILWKELPELLAGYEIMLDKDNLHGTEIFHEPTGRWFMLNLYSFKVPDTEQTDNVLTIHDFTELRKMTGTLEKTNRELEQAYNDLKAFQVHITQQEKMASIGQLAAGVAHEINNPTGFIMSNLSSLQKYLNRLSEFIDLQSGAAEKMTDEKVREVRDFRKTQKIDFIIGDINNLIMESLEGADRIKRIVQDLKSFSHVDEAEHKPADINAGIESTINIVWNEIKYKATVKKEYGNIPKTRCNPGQMNQVFMNLLVNAAHAIEKQGEIAVKTWMDGGYIYVMISDTGTGIPPEKINRIFEPFYTTKEVGKGTGLGLSIAYDIIKKHNGEIFVKSEYGRGTAFTIKIPVVEE